MPETSTTTAPTAAPDATPVMPGSASGFRKTACITAPTPASAAPTTPATTTLGARTSRTSGESGESASTSACRTSHQPSVPGPMETPAIITATSNTPAAAIGHHANRLGRTDDEVETRVSTRGSGGATAVMPFVRILRIHPNDNSNHFQ